MSAADDGISRLAERVLGALREQRWLLQTDPLLPSVVTLVVGAPVSGSWWSHPEAPQIFQVLQALEASPDLIQVKLVKGKVTLLHRSVWPDLLAVASADEAWQTDDLPRAARLLREQTNRQGTLRLDETEPWSSSTKPGAAARELELRLLIHSEDVHTESGRHTKRLESWAHLMQRLGVLGALPPAPQARASIESLMPDGGRKLLPWLRAAKRKRTRFA